MVWRTVKTKWEIQTLLRGFEMVAFQTKEKDLNFSFYFNSSPDKLNSKIVLRVI